MNTIQQQAENVSLGRGDLIMENQPEIPTIADGENFVPTGISAIYSLPFTLYSLEDLPLLENNARGWRYKIHVPIQVDPLTLKS